MTQSDLLRYIQRTNPEMTMERMLKELSKRHYSSIALVIACENTKKPACDDTTNA